MTLLYFATAFVIILVILLIIRLWFYRYKSCSKLSRNESRARGTILIQTNNGVEQVKQKDLAEILARIAEQLEANKAGFTVNRKDSALQRDVDYAISNLRAFLKENPENGRALCTLELHTNELAQQMDNSINPTPADWEATYRNLLAHEDDDRDLAGNATGEGKLRYLLKHIDLAVRLLRGSVCSVNAQLDVDKLRDLLISMQDQISATGQIENPSYTYGVNPFNRYDRPPVLPLFLEDQFSTEPFQSKPNMLHARPSRAQFGSVGQQLNQSIRSVNGTAPLDNVNYINEPGAVNTNNANHARSEKFNRTYTNFVRGVAQESYHAGDARTKNLENFDSMLLNEVNNLVDKSYYDMPFSKGSMGDQLVPGNITLAGPDYSEIVDKRVIGDKSLEGTVEQDINGFAPPGHILAQLYDPSDMYTVNSGACAGKVLADDDVVRECIAPGAADWQALAGDATAMLGCVGENCYSPENYKGWFDAMQDTSAAHDAYGIDYYSPASIRDF